MNRFAWKLLSALSAIAIVIVLTTNGCSGQCTPDKGCFPPLGDLILGREVDVTSSCTEGDPYNLSGEVVMCDSSVNSPSFINDDEGDNTTWVSGYISNATLPFIIEVSFEGPVLFQSTEIVWESRVPAALTLERNNGSDWIPYRYFASNCEKYYNLPDTGIAPPLLMDYDQEAVCTTMETHLFLGSEMPFDTASQLPNGTSADVVFVYRAITGLRIVVDAIFEGALFGDLSNVISISQWTTVGTCICNGHADMCSPIDDEPIYPGKAYAGCMCSHNTAGTNCDFCATGFNDQEWAPGNETDANECKACQCNGHATDCYYDPSIMSGSCIDCQHNTTGHNCSSCQDTYYPDPSKLVMEPDYCIACGCDEVGVIDGNITCSSDGECNCKPNVASDKCSSCLDGYWNLTQDNPNGCQECDCGEGTQQSNGVKLCNTNTGICQCKSDNVIGDRCDSCVEGWYKLSEGCNKECDCNPAGSVNSSCDPIEGQCNCIDNVHGTVCDMVDSGYYYKTLDDITLEAEETDSINELTLITPIEDPLTFSGSGFLLVPSTGATIVFRGAVDVTANYTVVLRYKSSEKITGVTVTVSESENSRKRRAMDIVNTVELLASERSEPSLGDFPNEVPTPIPLSSDTQHQITVVYSPPPQSEYEWMLDSVVLLPDVTENLIDLSCLPLSLPVVRGPYCDLATFELSITHNGQLFSCEEPNSLGLNQTESCDPHGQIYSCKTGYTGSLCDQCSNGYYNSSGLCEKCPNTCNSTGAVNVACNLQTGSCDCHDNVTGDACNTCLIGHYNLTKDGCTDCRCYNSNQTCNEEGDCDCPLTTVSPRCDACIEGHYNLTSDGCTPCNCNVDIYASSNNCDLTTGQCNCTGNVIGQQCTECPSTHYNTSGSTAGQDHCMECFCFGLTSECSPSDQDYTLTAVTTDFTTFEFCNVIAMRELCTLGWTLHDIVLQYVGSNGLWYQIFGLDNPDSEFISPDTFHGDFKLAYGQNIVFQFELPSISDIIKDYVSLSNGDVTIFAYFNNYIVNDMDYTFNIPLVESQWRVGSLTGSPANLSIFIAVLSNVTDFRFTGFFTDGIVATNWLKMVQLEYIVPVTSLSPNMSAENIYITENCSCPEGHSLPFCDQCIEGYYKEVDNCVEPCLECQCNGLATLCETPSGACINCAGNSTGDHCEQCIPGYYGDPENNITCIPCDCNGFDLTCDSNGVCVNCTDGYRGDNCQSCDNGYYNVEGECIPCSCDNNNVNKSVDPYCDSITGQCLNCTGNTEGFYCDQCINGYYNNSDSSSLVCEACDCDPDFCLPGICDSITGQCMCENPNAIGDCTECRDGYYSNVTNDELCIQCPCPSANNSHASSCYVDSDGLIKCECFEQYTGDLCDECQIGYFGDPEIGICNDCECNGNIDHSNDSYCDTMTGFCINCLNNTHGGECENCKNGYYGNPAFEIPCQPCSNCSKSGTLNETCDMVTGRCLCKENVTGVNCSVCIDGMYGAPDLSIDCQDCAEVCMNVDNPICHLSEDLKTPICDNCGPAYDGPLCQSCANGYWNNSNVCMLCECNGNVDTALGLVCDPDNGTCLNCQNNTFGDSCEQCVVGYYGDIPNKIPCTKCSCDEGGVTDAMCNSTNGECLCKPFVNSSTNCSTCNSGYWGFNGTDGCKPCECCSHGSISMECNQITGECSCLPGVNGFQCCQCREDYYNMSATGCTACNCSSILSLNQSCNETGHCFCKEGAVGMKCDECDSFGYFGTAPDCMRCHDCFFSWNDILTDASENVSYLLTQVQTILDYYGTETDDESIRNAIKMVEDTISTANETLRMISIDAQLLTTINTTLQKVLIVLEELQRRVDSLSSAINSTMILMDKVQAFMDSMDADLAGLEEVHQNITDLVTLANSLQTEAVQSSQAISQNQIYIATLQATVDMLYSNVTISELSLQWSSESSNMSHVVAMMAKSVAVNISIVNTEYMIAQRQVDEIESRLFEETADVEQLVEELWMLDQTLTQFNEKLNSISVLSQALLDSTEAIEARTANLLADIDSVTVASNNTLASAQMLADKVGVAQEDAEDIAGDLTMANQSAQQLNQIPVPSISEAWNISQAINSTIIPQEEVDSVLKDANETAMEARDYLERALDESAKVEELEGLVDSIETNRDSVSETIDEVEETLSDITEDIKDIEDTLNKVEENSIASSDIKDQQMKFSDTESGLAVGEEKLNSVTEDAGKALSNATALKSIVTEESGKIDSEVSKLNELEMDASKASIDSMSDLNKATEAQTMADSSKTEANMAPSLQQLQGAVNSANKLCIKY